MSARNLFVAMLLLAATAAFVAAQETPKTIKGGVLNSKAVSLPKPAYPDLARKANVQGTVRVEVVIDESGNVEAATAIKDDNSENELSSEIGDAWAALRTAAENAALASKFSPTLLSGNPVKVSGVIVYNFVTSAASDEKRSAIDGGIINGKAVELPSPAYPAAALAVRASGAVMVRVLIDEYGNVISAAAVSGHPLLQASAVTAARAARFEPTMLSGAPVKVAGILTYNFVLPKKAE